MTKKEAEEIIKTIGHQITLRNRISLDEERSYFRSQGFLEGLNSAEALDRPEVKELVEALDFLYLEIADYIRLNNLGDVHHNRSMQMARAALSNYKKAIGEEK